MLIINGAQLVQPDIRTDNGVIHIIDRVLAPVANWATIATYVETPTLPHLSFMWVHVLQVLSSTELCRCQKFDCNNSEKILLLHATSFFFSFSLWPWKPQCQLCGAGLQLHFPHVFFHWSFVQMRKESTLLSIIYTLTSTLQNKCQLTLKHTFKTRSLKHNYRYKKNC